MVCSRRGVDATRSIPGGILVGTDGEAGAAQSGTVVVARISGEPTESLLRTTHEQVIGLVREPDEAGCSTTRWR